MEWVSLVQALSFTHVAEKHNNAAPLLAVPPFASSAQKIIQSFSSFYLSVCVCVTLCMLYRVCGAIIYIPKMHSSSRSNSDVNVFKSECASLTPTISSPLKSHNSRKVVHGTQKNVQFRANYMCGVYVIWCIRAYIGSGFDVREFGVHSRTHVFSILCSMWSIHKRPGR